MESEGGFTILLYYYIIIALAAEGNKITGEKNGIFCNTDLFWYFRSSTCTTSLKYERRSLRFIF